MSHLRTSVFQFALADGRRRNHTEAVALREPSRLPFGPARARLYLLAEHAAANGQEHRLCQVVMREIQLAFAAAEGAGVAPALAHAIHNVNQNLWQGGQGLPPHKRLPIGLVAVAINGADAYVCQVVTGQIFVARGAQAIAWPSFQYWRDLNATNLTPPTALGQVPDFMPQIGHCRLEPGDTLLLTSSNLARLLDESTIGELSTSLNDNLVGGLCRMAEDYGLLHTSGMALRIDGTKQAATNGSALAFQPYEVGLAPEGASHDVPAAESGSGAKWPSPVAVQDMVNAHSTVTHNENTSADVDVNSGEFSAEQLPDNVVRLYETLPLATDPGPNDEVDDSEAVHVDYVRRPVSVAGRRALRSRWLDALSASIVMATEIVRQPPSPNRRATHARPPAGGRSASSVAEPLFRMGGKLFPATADGFSSPSLAMPTVRLPQVSVNGFLVAAMLVAVLMLVAAGFQTFTRQGGPAFFGDSATSVSEVSRPLVEDRAGQTAIVRDAPASPLVASAVPTPVAAPADLSTPNLRTVLARADTIEQNSARSITEPPGRSTASNLGSVTVLADLGASGTPATTPKQLVFGRGNIYVLDPYTSTLYLVDSAGKPQATLLARGWSIAREKVLDLLGVTWRGDTLVVIDKNRAYTLDGPSGTWRVSPVAAMGLGAGVHQVASFDGGLYVLDSAKGQVLKYPQGAYQKPPVQWLKTPDRSELAGAIDLAIDGKIYALTASGHLVTLMRGDVERRQAIDVSPALQSPTAIISPPDSAFLYVADSTGRILKLTKDGAVVAQFRSADTSTSLANLSSLWVDEASQTLYAVAGNTVVRVAMPERGRSPLS